MENKGQVGNFLPYILIGIIIVLIFAVVVIPIAYTGNEVFDELKEEKNFGSSNNTVAKINQVQDFMIPGFDQLVFFVLIAIFIGTIVIAVFTDFHPILLGVLILAFILLIVIGGLFANVYDEVRDTSILTSTADEFSFTNLIMGSQLPIIITILGAICIIIILAKRGGQTSPV
jgi:hypothetical protein